MRVLNSITNNFDGPGLVVGYIYLCPGCKMGHAVYTVASSKDPSRHIWGFNRNMVEPTFHPSILSKYTGYDKETGQQQERICHHFVRNGMIEFLPDCTHELAGKTVPMIVRDD